MAPKLQAHGLKARSHQPLNDLRQSERPNAMRKKRKLEGVTGSAKSVGLRLRASTSRGRNRGPDASSAPEIWDVAGLNRESPTARKREKHAVKSDWRGRLGTSGFRAFAIPAWLIPIPNLAVDTARGLQSPKPNRGQAATEVLEGQPHRQNQSVQETKIFRGHARWRVTCIGARRPRQSFSNRDFLDHSHE